MQSTDTEMDTQEETEDKWLSAWTRKAFIPVANFEWQGSPTFDDSLWKDGIVRP